MDAQGWTWQRTRGEEGHVWQAVAPGGWRQRGVRQGPAARCYVGGDRGRECSSGTWLCVRAGVSHFGILMIAFTYYIHSRFDGCESTAVKSFRGAVRAIRRTWSRTWHLMADTSAAEGPRGTIVWSATALSRHGGSDDYVVGCARSSHVGSGQGIRTTNTEYAALPSCSHDMLIQIRITNTQSRWTVKRTSHSEISHFHTSISPQR